MSFVSGPGRGGASTAHVLDELKLVVENHVQYIQSLDTVYSTEHSSTSSGSSFTDSGKMNSTTG